MRSRWLRSVLIATTAMVVLAIPAAAHEHLIVGEQAVVSNTDGDGLNIRSEPSLGSNVHFVASEGTPMSVTGGPEHTGDGAWYSVHINGTDAWAMSDYISRAPSSAGAQVQVVNTDGHGLRLRSDASLESETLTVIAEGATVEVVGAEVTDGSGTTWANIAYNGYTGFAHTGYLIVTDGNNQPAVSDADNQEPEEQVAEPDPEPEPAMSNTNGVAAGGNAMIVDTNGHGLNIRHGAGYGHSVVTVAAEGDVLQVLDGPEVDGDGVNWWHVDYRGHSGWAHGGYLQGTDAPATEEGTGSGAASEPEGDQEQAQAPANSPIGQQIVNEAMQYLGYPYVWGGTSPAGFDCSGFIFYVVNQVTGADFPRVMESQVNRGTYVPADQLQPGDLVFQQNTYRWGLSHAGIYIGNGQFIHASTPGSGVIISDLWDSYWGQRYYTARRIS